MCSDTRGSGWDVSASEGNYVLAPLELSELMVGVLRESGEVVIANAAFRELGERYGRPLREHLVAEYARLAPGYSSVSDLHLQRSHSSAVTIRWHVARYDTPPGGLLAIGEDVTESRETESKLADRALRDPLTGLPNRTLLADRVSQALAAAQRRDEPCAFIVFDLDGFKQVNDDFGHDAGDEVLRQIGPRLGALLRESDTLARLGGDEFTVLLPPPADLVSALVAAEKVRTAFASTYTAAGADVSVGASVGIALFPQHGRDAATLLRAADVAMYSAKRTGAGVAVYDHSLDLGSVAGSARLAELKEAIAGGELRVVYQPMVRLGERRVTGAEALVRWLHPRLGMLHPAAFLPLAERTDLMVQLFECVLDDAMARCAQWRDDGSSAGVSVNLSVRNVLDPAAPAVVARSLLRYGLEPSVLTLEFNERELGREPHRLERALRDLADTGVRLALDDFGTGDISLRTLRALPIHEIKLDRALIATLRSDPDSRSFVRTGIAVGHDIGLEVVAKGVEDSGTLALLGRLHCDVGQGNLFAGPVESRELTAAVADVERTGRAGD